MNAFLVWSLLPRHVAPSFRRSEGMPFLPSVHKSRNQAGVRALQVCVHSAEVFPQLGNVHAVSYIYGHLQYLLSEGLGQVLCKSAMEYHA